MHMHKSILTKRHPKTLHRRYFSMLERRPQPVVVVGGGPSGLITSLLLAQYRVPSVVLDAQTTEARFKHPQAHFLNTRTMEILKFWLPQVSQRVLEAMPPVEQWEAFRFGRNMSDPPLATVIHPVDRPLQAGRDSNGVLQEHVVVTNVSEPTNLLSACTVGHLAQHTFCRILYETANQSSYIKLLYNTKVTRVQQQQQKEKHSLLLSTDNGHSFGTTICVAADGAHSFVREHVCQIPRRGQEGIQHLMNIHVTVPREQAHRLHANQNFAMLYSIFSEAVVAMVVCHSIGEYVIQIPYFPPYQDPHTDFAPTKISRIIQAIFGDTITEWNVVSAKPWTMSALIADRFYNDRGIALVGDAAHIFPPAGGFGMNTGIQDAHNLAWKIAGIYHKNRFKDLQQLLQSYHNERRAIAQQNAALSVRNYRRLLQVTKACYLNEQHPSLLKWTLGISPLPLPAKQEIFHNLLNTALFPLSWLKYPDSMYATHIRNNLRHVLKQGAGLPLLFPQHELGFTYKIPRSCAEDSYRSDTDGQHPKITEGMLLPHNYVQIIRAKGFPTLEGQQISTSELPVRFSKGHLPTFILVALENCLISPTGLQHTCDEISQKLELPVQLLHLTTTANASSNENWEIVVSCNDGSAAFDYSKSSAALVLVRPDGHVAWKSEKDEHLTDLSSLLLVYAKHSFLHHEVA